MTVCNFVFCFLFFNKNNYLLLELVKLQRGLCQFLALGSEEQVAVSVLLPT